MASLIKGLLGGGAAAEDEPSGAEIIEKLKNRSVLQTIKCSIIRQITNLTDFLHYVGIMYVK